MNFSKSDFLLKTDLKIFLKDILEYKLIDIQILILQKSFNDSPYYNSSIFYFKDRRIKSYIFNNKDWSISFLKFVELIKGKYLIIFNKLIKIKQLDLHQIYNIIKGNIENIINLKFENNETFYLIRTKILRDILDSNQNFRNFNELSKKILLFYKNVF